MRVASWNINNVTKRVDLLLDWLARTSPDVVALQELKTPTENFPSDALLEAGYRSLVVGQKTWNGVALLSKTELVPVLSALPGDAKDKEARYVEAAVNGILFCCLYLPNGNPQPGPKFDYKLRWFERLRERAAQLWAAGQPVVLLGDWNVVPTDADIYKPDTWRDDALLQPAPRKAFADVLSQGWTDALKSVVPTDTPFTFWDYRRKRWERNAGLRIDHILVSASIAVRDAGVDRDERGKESPSDHAPVWAELELGKASRPSKAAATRKPPEANKTQPSSKAAALPTFATAVKTALPAKLTPQLATLATGVPTAGEWIYEIKFDGYRIMTRIDRGKAQLITRGGHDWSAKMPQLVAALENLGLSSAWLDGEIVVLGDDGLPNFNALQNAFDRTRTDAIVYYVFDVPYFEGRDLREVPLSERRKLLQQFFEKVESEQVRFSNALDGDGSSILHSACQLNLEGVIAKRADAPYVSKRTETWLKLKCQQRQEFVIGGFTDRKADKSSSEIGSLLLGIHNDAGNLVSVGSVGTGWDSKAATEIKQLLVKLEVSECPFDAQGIKKGRWSKRAAAAERWVKPQLIAEVGFGEWTPDGQIRHAVFKGMRADKPAKAITRERAASPAGAKPARAAASTTKITHPERVVDPSTGLTKLDLVRYCESVADWMVPHLKGRPCSLVRGPSGITGQLFFQKHAEKLNIPDVRDLDPELMPGHEPLLEVPSAKAIAGAAQMNVIEFHTWNALAKKFDKPDRMIFDLDPGEGVAWERVQEAATLTHTLLNELDLQAWLKTSGGKGLHVVVPLAPRYGWDVVKGFSQAVVQHLARVIPDRFVAKSGPSNRKGKIFVDYLRNSHGATTAAAFSARARPGLGVSMPIAWEQLDKIKSGAQWTITTAREHLSFQTTDPWVDYWTTKQSIAAAMKALGFRPKDSK